MTYTSILLGSLAEVAILSMAVVTRQLLGGEVGEQGLPTWPHVSMHLVGIRGNYELKLIRANNEPETTR